VEEGWGGLGGPVGFVAGGYCCVCGRLSGDIVGGKRSWRL
jgi:hypothetical protein